jgi:hypothetical protein
MRLEERALDLVETEYEQAVQAPYPLLYPDLVMWFEQSAGGLYY